MAKKTSSSQKLLPRKPRVQIEYDVEIGDAIRLVELPWITGVMADLSGANTDELADLEDRKFSEIDAENFDSYMKSQKPRLAFATENSITGEGRLGVDVTLESMEDFNPDDFARKVGAETLEISITEEGKGDNKLYILDPENPESVKFGGEVSSLDLLTLEYTAYKLGENASDIEVSVIPDVRNPKQWNFRIVRKGPLAKLLDARSKLKELLIKVDGKAGAQKALEEILADKSAVEKSIQEHADSMKIEE